MTQRPECREDDFARVGAGPRQDGGVVRKPARWHVGQGRERVPATDDDIQWIVPDFLDAQWWLRAGRQCHDRQFEIAVRHRAAGTLRVHEAQVEPHRGVGVVETLERGRQPVQPDMVAGGHGQLAGHGAGEVGNRTPDVVELAQHAAGAGVECAPGFGQTDAAADAVKERRPEFGFEHGDALADGRLGEEDALAGA